MKINILFIIFVLSSLFLISCDDGGTNEPRGGHGELCYEDHTCDAYSKFRYKERYHSDYVIPSTSTISSIADIKYSCEQNGNKEYRCVYDHEINVEPTIYECLKAMQPGLFAKNVYEGETLTTSKALTFEEIDCSHEEIKFKSLHGIGYFKNLEKLTVVADYDFNEYSLEKLVKLNYLSLQNFSEEQFKLLKKKFFTANSLTGLKIVSSKLSDIDFIGSFTNLTYLNLYNNPIYSIEALKPLKKLEHLNIRNTCVTDISPIWKTLVRNNALVERPECGENLYENCEF